MVHVLEDQILRGKDPHARAELARKVARLWEEQLEDPREAADAWRRVLRMKPGDADAQAGLERAKADMLNDKRKRGSRRARRSTPEDERAAEAAAARPVVNAKHCGREGGAAGRAEERPVNGRCPRRMRPTEESRPRQYDAEGRRRCRGSRAPRRPVEEAPDIRATRPEVEAATSCSRWRRQRARIGWPARGRRRRRGGIGERASVD